LCGVSPDTPPRSLACALHLGLFDQIVSLTSLKKLLEQIEIANRRYGLLKKNDSIVVAVSGGPDSIALLTLLAKLRRKFALTLHAVYLDHGLQKEASKRFLGVARAATANLSLPFFTKTVSVRRLAHSQRRSLEEAGRIARYEFFKSVCQKTGASKIATAHTLDDQAETMLMRILRGSGLRGLGGIPFRRKEGAYEVIRPLLLCEKKDILSYLKENKISFCLDETNRDPAFTRNRVRHELLPLIQRRFNPQIKESLSALRTISEEAQAYLEQVSDRLFKKISKKNKRRVSLPLKSLSHLPGALRREVLLKALASTRGDLKRFTQTHVASTLELLSSGEYPLELHLPGGIIVRKTEKYLEFAAD